MLELNMSLRKYIYSLESRMDNLRNSYGSFIAEHQINNPDFAEKFWVDVFSVQSRTLYLI